MYKEELIYVLAGMVLILPLFFVMQGSGITYNIVGEKDEVAILETQVIVLETQLEEQKEAYKLLEISKPSTPEYTWVGIYAMLIVGMVCVTYISTRPKEKENKKKVVK